MSAARRLTYQLRVRMLDALHHSSVAPILASALFLMSRILRPFQPAQSLAWLCRSHTILMHALADARFPARLNRMIERDLIRASARDGMGEALAHRGARVPPPKPQVGIVLKAPRFEADRVVEKGVVVLKNTERMDTFRRYIAMDSLLRDYTIVLEPSWSGYANPRLLAFSVFRDHPIVVMSSCAADHRFLEHLNSNLRPIAIGAGDWVDPRIFYPLEGQPKRFDAVMVARWSRVKRHHLLFRTLAGMADPSYRVAIVAGTVSIDTDRGAILAMIDHYHLGDRVTVFENLKPSGVNEILNQSKVNLLLSQQEGSNRSLFEGFFAGVPGLAFANNIGIALDHFTPQTGRLIAEDELPAALLYFREHWREFDPRPWAMANITPEVTTATLNGVLKQLALERGEPWTQDIVAKCNRPEMHYYPEENDGHGFATIEDLFVRYAR